MFSSAKNFLIGAGMIAAGAALTIATGGAIAPLFVVLGVTGGAFTSGQALTNLKNVFKPKKTANSEPKNGKQTENNTEPNADNRADAKPNGNNEPNPNNQEPQPELQSGSKAGQSAREIALDKAEMAKSYLEYETYIAEANGYPTLDEFDASVIKFLKETKVPADKCFKGSEGQSLYEYIFGELKDANMPENRMLYHGTTPENALAIKKNGINLEYSTGMNDAGRALYTTVSNNTRYTQGGGATVAIQAKPNARFANMPRTLDGQKSRIDTVNLVFQNNELPLPFKRTFVATKTHYLNNVLKDVITRHIMKLGYDGIQTGSKSAGGEFFAIFNPDAVTIIQ